MHTVTYVMLNIVVLLVCCVAGWVVGYFYDDMKAFAVKRIKGNDQ